MPTETQTFSRVFKVFDFLLGGLLLFPMILGGYLAAEGEAWPPASKALVVWAMIVLPLMAGLICTRLQANTRATITLTLVSIAVAVYSLDVALEFGVDESIAEITADEKLAAIDEVGTLEKVRELRSRGREAYPFVTPHTWVSDPLKVRGKPRLPLGGVPNVTTVACNETGRYFIYRSDPAGLNNPPSMWTSRGSSADADDHTGATQLMLIGDSFTQGFCVPEESSFASVLRARYPTTVNLGYAHNGPLLELAALREYGPRFKPDHVFWFLYEGNDLGINLPSEMGSKILRRYLEDPGYRQPVVPPARAITEALKEWTNKSIAEAPRTEDGPNRGTNAEDPPGPTLADIIFLRALRTRIATINQPTADINQPTAEEPNDPADANDPITSEKPGEPKYLSTFRDILLRAQQEVATWDGSLHLVYLPSFFSISGRRAPYNRGDLASMSRDLDIDFIDMFEHLSEHPDPLAMYPFRRFGHFSIEGNRVVADAVIARISAR